MIARNKRIYLSKIHSSLLVGLSLLGLLMVGAMGCGSGDDGEKPCVKQADCGPGFECVNSKCAPLECDTAHPCPSGLECVVNVCKPKQVSTECINSSDCQYPGIQNCVNGACKYIACVKNSQCDGGVCKKDADGEQGHCTPDSSVACTSGTECTEFQVCDAASKTCEDKGEGCSCSPFEECTATDPKCQTKECEEPEDCNDDNACTTEICIDYHCQNVPVEEENCCNEDVDCEDFNACTSQKCSDNVCIYEGVAEECCNAHSECNDSDPCTIDQCLGNICFHPVNDNKPECKCKSTKDCDDSNLCTVDSCIDQYCSYSKTNKPDVVGCCSSDEECNDYNDATQDTCTYFTCTHIILKPCNTKDDCNDVDACTLDTCENGYCKNISVSDPLCCNTDANCKDENPLTFDACVNNRCVHSFAEEPIECSGSNTCDDSNPCTDEECVSKQCSYTLKSEAGCCLEDVNCDDSNECTINTCVDFQCQMEVATTQGCCTAVEDCADFNICTIENCKDYHCTVDLVSELTEWSANFDDGTTADFTFSGGSGTVKWQITEYKSNDGLFSLYYGDLTTHTYQLEYAAHSGTALSPVIKLPNENSISLRFAASLDLDYYDSLELYVVGDSEVKVWDQYDVGTSTSGQFVPTTVDLSSFKGQSIMLKFVFDAEEAWWIGYYEGAYIDSLSIVTPCTVKSCSKDDDCDDKDACTQDICNEHEICTNEIIPECCNIDKECDDTDECTQDKCTDHACEYINLCCYSDDECNDNDDCTIDACDGGDCAYKLKQSPECCTPNLLVADWDDEVPLEFTVTTDGSNVKWQVTNLRYVSEPNSFYYGDPKQHNFNSGSTTWGSALSPPVLLPPSGDVSLSFDMFIDTETLSSYDSFWVSIVHGGVDKQVWSKASLGYSDYNKWIHVEVALTEFLGQQVSVQLSFDSKDSSSNSGEGVYVDNLKVTMPCVIVDCKQDTECDDNEPCTQDSCVDGQCIYTDIEGCCYEKSDCNDNDSCTEDACNKETHQCVNTLICCQVDSDCDDDDECTLDTCNTDGSCSYSLNPTPTCCDDEIFSTNFNDGTLNGYVVNSSDPSVTWQVSAKRFTSPAYSLYYGDIVDMNYKGSGINEGTVLSPPFFLQPGIAAQLSFQVYLAVEPGENFDLLTVSIVADNSTVEVWDKSSIEETNYKKWIPVMAELGDTFAGQSVQLQFTFDTVDELGNTGEGVYIDDIVVGSQCQ